MIKIAVGLPQVGDDVRAVVAAAREAEAAGAWGVWVFDNLEPFGDRRKPVLEGWSLLGPLARATSRVRLISLVTRAGLRHPALVARMASVVQAAAGGRFVLGLGVGDEVAAGEHRRFGVPFPAHRERVAALEETLRQVRAGEGLRPSVEPPQIWVGGGSPTLLRLAAAEAAAWHGWELVPEDFRARAVRVRELAGRPIECWWGGVFDPASAERTLEELRLAGCDGVTWMLRSSDEPIGRERLLTLLRETQSSKR